jgi:hypothetical protein
MAAQNALEIFIGLQTLIRASDYLKKLVLILIQKAPDT